MEIIKTNTYERLFSNKEQIALLLDKRMERYFNVLDDCTGY